MYAVLVSNNTRVIPKVMHVCTWETQNATIMHENLKKFSFRVEEHNVKILLCLTEWKWQSYVSKHGANIGFMHKYRVVHSSIFYVYEERRWMWSIENLAKCMVKVV